VELVPAHGATQSGGLITAPISADPPGIYPAVLTACLRYFHLDIAEVHTEEGRLYLLVAIDRTSKFAYVELHEKATTRIAADFLRALLKAVPYKVHTILTDNGTHFTTPGNKSSAAPDIKRALETGEPFRGRAGSRLPLGVPATIMFFASGAL
jgi:hypothetical protein